MKLEWDKQGERYFESAVDHGVLYLPNQAGVPWNGLVSVEESVSGGDVEELFFDGLKYLDWVGNEDFQATLQAYSRPKEFAVCEGVATLAPGLRATRQARQPFGLAYRTKIGNDTEGVDHGYRIHLVYNVTASPTTRSYQTISNSPEPTNLQWELNTAPILPGADVNDPNSDPNDWVWPEGYAAPGWPMGPDGNTPVPGWKATPYIIIDSTKFDPNDPNHKFILDDIEGRLYGTDLNLPYLPSQLDTINILNGHGDLAPIPDWAKTTDPNPPTLMRYSFAPSAFVLSPASYEDPGGVQQDASMLSDGNDSTALELTWTMGVENSGGVRLRFPAVPNAKNIDWDSLLVRLVPDVMNSFGIQVYVTFETMDPSPRARARWNDIPDSSGITDVPPGGDPVTYNPTPRLYDNGDPILTWNTPDDGHEYVDALQVGNFSIKLEAQVNGPFVSGSSYRVFIDEVSLVYLA